MAKRIEVEACRCGSADVGIFDAWDYQMGWTNYWVECWKCHHCGPDRNSTTSAKKAWNAMAVKERERKEAERGAQD